MMKIIYFGTDVFLSVFSWLLESEHTVTDLYTYHNPEEYIRDEGVCALAHRHNIPVHYERLSEAEIVQLFAAGKCDLLLSAEYDAKIPVPDIDSFRGVNIHNSLLPEGRGYFPVEMRIFQQYDYGGVTIHKLAEKFDEGDIVLQRKFSISSTENDRAVYAKCNHLAAEMVKELLRDFSGYWAEAKKQTGGSYWEKPSCADYTVTEKMTVEQAEHIYRSFGRFTEIVYRNKNYKVEHLVTPNSKAWLSSPDIMRDNPYIAYPVLDGVIGVYLQAPLK